jgi:hypothetical protein
MTHPVITKFAMTAEKSALQDVSVEKDMLEMTLANAFRKKSVRLYVLISKHSVNVVQMAAKQLAKILTFRQSVKEHASPDVYVKRDCYEITTAFVSILKNVPMVQF